MRIIDEASEIEFRELNKDIERISNRYLSLRAQIREKESEIKEQSSLKGELHDLQSKISILEQSDYKTVLTNFESSKKREIEIKSWEHSITDNKLILEDYLKQLSIKKIDESLFADESEFLELFLGYDEKLSDLSGKIYDIIKGFEGIIDDFKEQYEKSEVYKNINYSFEEYKILIKTLEGEGFKNIHEYQNLISKREKVQEKIDAIKQIELEKSILDQQAERCSAALKDCRNKITENRQAFVRNILSTDGYVKIEVTPYANQYDLQKSLRKILKKETGFEKDFDNLTNRVLESPSYIEGLDKIKKCIVDIYLGSTNEAQDKRFISHIRGLDPESIDRLICFYPEDGLEVKYLDQKNRQYISIKKGSPGQKTAAILSFLLTYGTEPLILDQPEDDLENRLIYDLIVSQLKSIKLKRQVIIVTHNANIVVNGDSENIIPLIIGSNAQTNISGQGGLQEKVIRDGICDVLEGGTEAFKLRYKRINV